MQTTISIRTPCPIVQSSRTFQGLYYGYSSPTPSQVKVHTVFPPQENAFVKRFPMFEAIMGPIVFLVAYQERPNSQPNHAFFSLAPNTQLTGEILTVRSGGEVLVTAMGGRLGIEAAKEAVRAFVIKADAHKAMYRGRRNPPPLPALIEVV